MVIGPAGLAPIGGYGGTIPSPRNEDRVEANSLFGQRKVAVILKVA